jgi:succinate dehydrogenase / fumarate reductase flavoprotein subunit
LAQTKPGQIDTSDPACAQVEFDVKQRNKRLLGINGKRTVDSFHRELGRVLWDNCGMARSEASLIAALEQIPAIRAEFWENVNVPGENEELNQSLEKAGRVADFMELAELMCIDALHRTESCGGHFRLESQTPDGEALRDDENFSYVAAWEFNPSGGKPILNREPLTFEHVHPSQRSYK